MANLVIARTEHNSNTFNVVEEYEPYILFTGTYTQCLIYIGAMSLGHKHEEAFNYAKG